MREIETPEKPRHWMHTGERREKYSQAYRWRKDGPGVDVYILPEHGKLAPRKIRH
jgi:hypothetical protein